MFPENNFRQSVASIRILCRLLCCSGYIAAPLPETRAGQEQLRNTCCRCGSPEARLSPAVRQRKWGGDSLH
ncbi:hypothetical protein KC367_g129 [Hortaea werneckii]|nr:hypothetical protein KC367_g129 [Hortaea werneckii]